MAKTENWNLFDDEGLEFVDCNELRDRKSTGLEAESFWDESLKL